MQINGETYVPWNHFKIQMQLANEYREALRSVHDLGIAEVLAITETYFKDEESE